MAQPLAEPFGPLRRALDDFHVVAVLDALRQPVADVAAAGDQHPLVVVLEAAQLAHHRADVVLGGDEEHFVIGFDDGVALGNDRPVAAEDRRNPGVHVGHVLAQLAQLVAHQRAAVIGAHRHQLHAAGGEVDHLQGAGVLDQPLDVVGDHLLRADDHVDGNGVFVEQLVRAAGVVGGADTGDFGGGAEQGVGHLAGDHVDLVGVGDGDQHVGVFGAGFLEHPGIAAHAEHGANVQTVPQFPQALAVDVDDGDVVAFPRQVLRQGAAHLAGTENDDLHDRWSVTLLSSAALRLCRQAR